MPDNTGHRLAALKARAQRAADHETLPDQLAERMADVRFWQAKRAFWADKVTEAQNADKPPVWAGTADRKLAEVSEILELMQTDARQLNRKLQ